jgi:hypothetical protein
MHYVAQDVGPLLTAGLTDLPLLLILAGVLLCASIAAATLALIRRRRPAHGAASAGSSPARLAFKLTVAAVVLLAAGLYLWTEYGGISGMIEHFRGEPCCAAAADQPCCAKQENQPCCPAEAADQTQNNAGNAVTPGQSGTGTGPTGEDTDQ